MGGWSGMVDGPANAFVGCSANFTCWGELDGGEFACFPFMFIEANGRAKGSDRRWSMKEQRPATCRRLARNYYLVHQNWQAMGYSEYE
jgi:hypothetical protein